MAEESTLKRTRASGEVLDLLLREFEANHNPLPAQRKDISERTNMSEKAVRIWFQNRRAKLRKFERMGKLAKPPAPNTANSVHSTNSYPGSQRPNSNHSLSSNLLTNISAAGLRMQLMIPIELNEKYCFVDCLSLSVGLWQRIKSGSHDQAALESSLINLSPFTLNSVMSNVDLMVILSRKNLEVNYFFSAITNNSKILFRIFYPIASVVSCSLVDNNINKDNNELRLNLSRKPKFSVYFFNGVNSNLNQWSICDDFSEGQQVSSAYYAPGGTSTPHVLVGVKNSLQFLNSFIMEHNHIQHQQAYNVVAGSNFQGTDTPNSDYHSMVSHGEIAGSPQVNLEQENNGNFQIKPEWDDTPRSDLDYRLKVISPVANYEDHSPASTGSHHSNHNNTSNFHSSKPLGVAGVNELEEPNKKPEEFHDMFSTDTPDFFSTVQTPNANLIGAHEAHQDDNNLINSPSTNIHSFANTQASDKATPSRSEAAPRHADDRKREFGNTYTNELDEHVYNDAPAEQQYGFEMQANNPEFQANDLIVNSPAMSNGEPTPSTTVGAQVDNFIDYNGHY